jgi:hypothetical protein
MSDSPFSGKVCEKDQDIVESSLLKKDKGDDQTADNSTQIIIR